MKRIIVNADDFGISHGVNEAVMAAFEARSISSATILVNAAASEEAARLALANPALGAGLHFTLTSGTPVALPRGHALAPNGAFGGRSRLARLFILGRVRRDDVARELQAQWDCLLRWGVQPTHIDSHQHVHAIPPVFEAVARFCDRHGVAMRIPWRLNPRGVAKPFSRRMRESALALLVAYGYRRWAHSLRTNRGFGSVFDLGEVPRTLQLADYERIVSAATADPFELMVHPSGPAAEMAGVTRIGPVSEAEGAFLRTGRLREMLTARGFELSTYREVM